MAQLYDEDSSYETSVYSLQFQSRVDLLSKYGIFHRYSFRSLHSFKEICNSVEGKMMDRETQYVGFIHVTMNDIEDIDKIRSEIPRMIILYDFDEEKLVMKFMVGEAHELCTQLLGTYFDRVVNARIGTEDSLLPVGSTQFRGFRRMKEGDAAFKPSTRELESAWPTIVFEVGVSEGISQLRLDAGFWLENSQGQTRIVIVVFIDKAARTILIERWQVAPQQRPIQNMGVPNPYAWNVVPTQMQSLTLQAGQNYIGPSLLIPADLVYDTPPVAGLGPGDFDITAQSLNRFNDVYWRGLV